MKKEKKNKKLETKEVKDSKKESKKKSAEEKKAGSVPETAEPTRPNPVAAELTVDPAVVKQLLIDAAVLYQNILVLPQTFAVSEASYSLYPSELKALDMIGQFSGINLTQLASNLGISKSAISKCSSKLLDKELIRKEKSPVNVREVVFTLTPNGQAVFDQLEKVQTNLFEPFHKSMAGFTPQQINDLHQMFLIIQSSLTEIIDRQS